MKSGACSTTDGATQLRDALMFEEFWRRGGPSAGFKLPLGPIENARW